MSDVLFTPGNREVKPIAESLIEKHHPHLKGVRIEYFFRHGKWEKNGRTMWGQAKKVSTLASFMANPDAYDDVPTGYVQGDPFFVMLINKDQWYGLSPAQKEALVDHELCHFRMKWNKADKCLKPSLASHDLEEFRAVVERHGYWEDGIKEFVDSAKKGGQVSLEIAA